MIEPAAVVSIGKNLGRVSAAIRTALYPATVACDERTSIDWARVVRGMASMLNEVMSRVAQIAHQVDVGHRLEQGD